MISLSLDLSISWSLHPLSLYILSIYLLSLFSLSLCLVSLSLVSLFLVYLFNSCLLYPLSLDLLTLDLLISSLFISCLFTPSLLISCLFISDLDVRSYQFQVHLISLETRLDMNSTSELLSEYVTQTDKPVLVVKDLEQDVELLTDLLSRSGLGQSAVYCLQTKTLVQVGKEEIYENEIEKCAGNYEIILYISNDVEILKSVSAVVNTDSIPLLSGERAYLSTPVLCF